MKFDLGPFNAAPTNPTRFTLYLISMVPAVLAAPRLNSLLHLDEEYRWLPFGICLLLCVIVLKKARQFFLRNIDATLLSPEEREWWLREREPGLWRYVLEKGLRAGAIIASALCGAATLLYGFAYAVGWAYGAPPWNSVPVATIGIAVLKLFVGACVLGCATFLFTWLDYEDDEREWQRKHPEEAA